MKTYTKDTILKLLKNKYKTTLLKLPRLPIENNLRLRMYIDDFSVYYLETFVINSPIQDVFENENYEEFTENEISRLIHEFLIYILIKHENLFQYSAKICRNVLTSKK